MDPSTLLVISVVLVAWVFIVWERRSRRRRDVGRHDLVLAKPPAICWTRSPAAASSLLSWLVAGLRLVYVHAQYPSIIAYGDCGTVAYGGSKLFVLVSHDVRTTREPWSA
jgi:hypothetical protein